MRLSPPTRFPASLLASLSLLWLGGLSAQAQFLTADDFFNSGAQFYISNNIPLAKERTETGLQIYPNDDKLKKLEQLLKQQQQQQQQNQQNQKDQQSQSQQGQQGQQKNQDQQQQQQDKQSQEQKEKEQQAQKEAEQKKEQEKQAQAAEQKKGESGDETNEVAEANGAHQMTPQEAKRLLDSQKGSEQYLALKPKDQPHPQNHVVKDW
jgi:Ca-activated chloride channel family protein